MGFRALPYDVAGAMAYNELTYNEIGATAGQLPAGYHQFIDEPRRCGFAYGTLPGHPECGEEAFMIEHDDDDTVSFRITAFSRPASRLAKIAGPLGVVAQGHITARYLRSLGKIVEQLA